MKKEVKKKGHIVADIDRLVGPIGSIVFMLGLPVFVQYLWYTCENHKCLELDSLFAIIENPKIFIPNVHLNSIYIFFIWWIIQFLMHMIIPGEKYLGYPISCDNSRLYYKLNGMISLILSLLVLIFATYFKYFDPSLIVDLFGEILFVSQVFSNFAVIWLYLKGRFLHEGNPSGNFILDLFYGYETNPRIYNLMFTDVKFFTEGRALITWIVLDFCFAFKQYTEIGYVTISLITVCLLHFIYVVHFFHNESNVLSMIDFTAENMGWMLFWGNVCWVPFCFCAPAYFCYFTGVDISIFSSVLICSFWFLGYLIFAQCNLQKHQFRTFPEKKIWGETPRVLKTSNGRNLLLSGWWGVARKMNYTGDLIQAFSFGLPCATIGIIPFIYGLYLTVLLIQRAGRDDRFCADKYGKDWAEYCKLVKYQMIPYVY